MKIKFIFTLLLSLFCLTCFAQKNDSPQKARMKFLGAFDAGQPGTSIIKLFDSTDDVVCYILTPDTATRKEIEKNKWVYEGNSIGSISCVKVKLAVIPIQQTPQK